MWVNVRCYNILHMPIWGWALLILSLVAAAVLVVRKFHGAPHAGKQ